MWKYRNEFIFTAAIAFALKAIVRPDAASVCGLVLFLSAHYLDRFFSAERAEAKIIARMKAMENEFTAVKTEISRISMTVGIRGFK